mgnify:FL=1
MTAGSRRGATPLSEQTLHGDPVAAEYEALAGIALERLTGYVEASRAGREPVGGHAPLGEVYAALELDRWTGPGGMDEVSFAGFLDRYLAYSTRLYHPAVIGHQTPAPEPPAAVADLIHGAVNNPMAIYEMGPSAVAVEFAVLNWMIARIGWTPQPLPPAQAPGGHAAGVLTHGGSLANLTGLLAARAAAAPEAWQEGVPGDLAVLVPENSHYSVARAVAIMGLGSRAVYPLETDGRGVVRADRLEAARERVRADGRRCMAVVANACATATGLHDPLRAMGEFCREYGVWFHVDACHGASALLSPRYRHLLDGLDLADSVVWDAHKMLQTSTLCAALLVRDAAAFQATFHQEASYLFYGDNRDGIDFVWRAVECTKAGLGLKVLLNLAFRGERGLGRYVEGRYAMARQFFEVIRARPGFECPWEPESNILCFRYGDDDALQVRIRERLLREGRYHMTSTLLNGRRYLRLTVINPLTDADTLAGLLDAIEETAAELAG